MSDQRHVDGVDWPEGFERTDPDDRASYPGGFEVTRHRAFASIMDELEAIDAYNIDVQTNAPHKSRQPHQPYKDATPDDPSVVVYFERDGQRYAIPCDRWDNLRDNARAIGSYLDAKRAIERYGVSTVDTEMSTQALPSGDDEEAIVVAGGETLEPHEVLEVSPDAPDAVVKGAYRELLKERHPDHGGTAEELKQLNQAKDSLLSE
jgi:hypothetical protein